MYSNIPLELRELNQWVVWKLEERSGEKPTKLPLDAKTGRLASVTNSETWSSFEVAASVANRVSGLGFVLTENDPYSVIDLDHTEDAEMRQKQIGIANAFDSYSERSPSMKGLHIWVRGSIPSGRRRGAVETYFSGRYMTVTGCVHNQAPICDYQDLLMQLWNEMNTTSTPGNDILDGSEKQTDKEIYDIACGAVNGEKFLSLWNGEWERYYPSQSEGDFCLINHLGFYTQNRNQIMRMFRMSALGKRAKAQRDSYLNGMITRSFDRQPAPIDMDDLKNSLEEMFAEQRKQLAELSKPKVIETYTTEAVCEPIEPPSTFDIPAGMVGEIAKFIYNAAPRPVPEIALSAALGLMAGICGRAYNVSNLGLNQYILLLAMTGAGKESISSGIDKLMGAVQKTVPACMEFVGPAEIASPQALTKYLSHTSACFASIVGEFGLTLAQISSPRANPNQVGLRKAMLELYGKSGHGKMFKSTIYSDKDKNSKIINGPAFTIIGESTPERFYETLDESMIYEGLLPRFTVIEYRGLRPKLNPNHLTAQPCPRLVEQLASVCAHALNINAGNRVELVGQTEGATKLFADFDSKCDENINKSNNEVSRQLWSRAHVKVLKLSALLAVGVNYFAPVIDESQVLWAIKLVELDVSNMLTRFENGDVGVKNAQNAQLTDLIKAFKRYLSEDWAAVSSYPGATQLTHHNKVIPHSFLTGYVRSRASYKHDKIGPVQALKTVLTSLLESGEVSELGPAEKTKLGLSKNGKVYAVEAKLLR